MIVQVTIGRIAEEASFGAYTYISVETIINNTTDAERYSLE